MRPNLFNLATKELSQDAFIAWLLQWTSPECQKYDALLSECAKRFAIELLSLQINPNQRPSEITTVEVERQWEKIDVCAEINGKYLLIIEDKTFTGKHSDQLPRYKESAIARCAKNNLQLSCVYLKTGSESASLLENVKRDGFAVFTRRDFLEILNHSPVNNHIFIDFKERLQALEDEESQFSKKFIKDWNDSNWVGFYRVLEKRRKNVNWEKVNPPGGNPFWNAVLNSNKNGNGTFWIQIEQGPLCFKIGWMSENQNAKYYYDTLMACCSKGSDIRKPNRFGNKNSTTKTIATVDRVNWLGSDDSLVDMDKVDARLGHYENLYLDFINKIQSENISAH
jgi:PD-(D/E)XK nuclease superfamily